MQKADKALADFISKSQKSMEPHTAGELEKAKEHATDVDTWRKEIMQKFNVMGAIIKWV